MAAGAITTMGWDCVTEAGWVVAEEISHWIGLAACVTVSARSGVQP